MTADEAIAAQLGLRLGSLPLGKRLPLMLDQDVFDGVSWTAGPHPVGWVLRPAPGALQIKVLGTMAGRTAAALLEDELLDVVLSHDYPPAVRLTASAD